jgi:hypothetical protein
MGKTFVRMEKGKCSFKNVINKTYRKKAMESLGVDGRTVLE